MAAYAQDALPPGLVARFDITQRLEYSDNPDFEVDGESDFYGRTILGFGLESITKVQRFSLNFGTDVEEGRSGQSSTDAVNPFVRLNYGRDTRNARLGLNLGYRESDVNSTFFDEDFPLDGDVINQDSGIRQTYSYGLDAAVGLEAPIGASFAARYTDITYTDTDDPDLTDRANTDLSGQIDFRIDPRITASLTAKYIDFDTQGNGVDRKTTGFGVATTLEITPIVTLEAALSQDRIERSGDQVGTNEGLSGSFGLVRDMPNGTLGLSYASDVSSNEDGRRSFLRVDRDMELPRGALFLSLGVTGADAVGTNPLLDVTYRYDLPTGSLSFGLSQDVVTDDDNNEQINTSLRAGFDRRINSLSGIGASIGFFDRNELQQAGNDGQRIDIDLTYRYDLTRDWGLVSGYRHSLSTQDSQSDRSANTIFVGLERSFNWTP